VKESSILGGQIKLSADCIGDALMRAEIEALQAARKARMRAKRLKALK
jgi:hypothetical protein